MTVTTILPPLLAEWYPSHEAGVPVYPCLGVVELRQGEDAIAPAGACVVRILGHGSYQLAPRYMIGRAPVLMTTPPGISGGVIDPAMGRWMLHCVSLSTRQAGLP